ncbi:DUF6338 family protein [Halorussus lipolyticus]|uniref:DUF6338 family protein n=1 Tax=Halorussus lipolyticus TaxID=3034024 RepID=UPI0023E788B7|nr:DUF6338 family protein [Halorussus sp. DT80]
MAPAPLSLGSLILLPLVLPGFAFVKAFIHGNKAVDDLPRVDKLGYALSAGVLSAMILLILFRHLGGNEPIRLGDTQNITSLGLLTGILIQTGLSCIMGYSAGKVKNKFHGDTEWTFSDKQQPWEYTKSELRQEYVTIVTSTGDNIEGIVARYNSLDEQGDIVISPLAKDSRKERAIEKENNAAYLSHKDVSQIHFHDQEKEGEYASLPKGDIEPDEVPEFQDLDDSGEQGDEDHSEEAPETEEAKEEN